MADAVALAEQLDDTLTELASAGFLTELDSGTVDQIVNYIPEPAATPWVGAATVLLLAALRRRRSHAEPWHPGRGSNPRPVA